MRGVCATHIGAGVGKNYENVFLPPTKICPSDPWSMSRGKDRNAFREVATFSSKQRRFECRFRATAFLPFPTTAARLTAPVDNENKIFSDF